MITLSDDLPTATRRVAHEIRKKAPKIGKRAEQEMQKNKDDIKNRMMCQ